MTRRTTPRSAAMESSGAMEKIRKLRPRAVRRWVAARAPFGPNCGSASTRSGEALAPACATTASDSCGETGPLDASSREPERIATRLPCRRNPATASVAATGTSPFSSTNSSSRRAEVVLASDVSDWSRRVRRSLDNKPWRKMLNTMNSSENRATYQSVRRNRKLLIIVELQVRAQNVAFAAAGVNQAAAEARVELGAQALDVDVDDIRERIEVLVPDVLADLLAAHHTVLVEHQELNESVFLGGEAHGFPGARGGVAGGVQGEVGDLEHLGAQAGGPPQQGAQAGQQFLEVEGLGKVVVGPGIEALNAIVHGAARGQHEDGSAKARTAQFPADGVAVLHRQHDVENHDIVLVDGGLIQGLFAVAGDIDGVGLFAEAFGDEAGDSGFVFNQQDPHAERPSTSIVRERR